MSSFVSASIAPHALAVTKSDTADNTWTYLYVGGAGDVKITTEGNDVVTYTVAAGTWMWVRTKLIWSTGTTATLIIGHR